ncbi:hypothetical protein QTP70_000170, partial [Hemibagrus guttatus]
EISPGELTLESLLDMSDEEVCETVQKFGASEDECARLNASLTCLRSAHKSGQKPSGPGAFPPLRDCIVSRTSSSIIGLQRSSTSSDVREDAVCFFSSRSAM